MAWGQISSDQISFYIIQPFWKLPSMLIIAKMDISNKHNRQKNTYLINIMCVSSNKVVNFDFIQYTKSALFYAFMYSINCYMHRSNISHHNDGYVWSNVSWEASPTHVWIPRAQHTQTMYLHAQSYCTLSNKSKPSVRRTGSLCPCLLTHQWHSYSQGNKHCEAF